MGAMRNRLIGLAALTALSACAESRAKFDAEVGPGMQMSDTFGAATINNVAVQSGMAGYAEGLNQRFQAEVDTTVTFAFNSAALDATARAILARQAAFIRAFPEVRFRVYGHTDLVGSESYNERLGQARANAALAFLISQGISPSRLDAVVSYGEDRPVIPTAGRERANRRAVTEVLGFVQSHPGVLNGKYAQIIFREYVDSARPSQEISGVSGDVSAVQ